MNHSTLSGTGTALGSCLQFIPDEGIDFERFVEEGGNLVAAEGRRDLGQAAHDLHDKIATLCEAHPRLARQLEFFESILVWDTGRLPEETRSEILFALLYALAEVDLVPDVFPEVGYADDTLVCEIVLKRHAADFQVFCTASGINWSALSAELGG